MDVFVKVNHLDPDHSGVIGWNNGELFTVKNAYISYSSKVRIIFEHFKVLNLNDLKFLFVESKWLMLELSQWTS